MAASTSSAAAADDVPRKVVFVDSNLGTNLAIKVSPTDTALDLKEKFIQMHQRCFPSFGEIKVDGVKVERRGLLYHLPDSLHVIDVLKGGKKDWYLSVDASSLVERLPLPGPAITEGTPESIVEIKESGNTQVTATVFRKGGEGTGLEVSQPAGNRKRLLDEGNPLEIGPSKRRKLKSQLSDTPNPANTTVMPSGGRDFAEQIHEDMMEVGDGHADVKPKNSNVLGSVRNSPHSKVPDRIRKTDDVPIQQADFEMNDPGTAEKNRQNVADRDGFLPLHMDVGFPLAEKAALANNQLLETDRHDMTGIFVSHVNVSAEEERVSHGLATKPTAENAVPPKRRKKSSRSKASAEKISNPQNDEASPVDNSLVEPEKVVSRSENRENSEKKLSEASRKDLAVVDAGKNHVEGHGLRKVLSEEVTENAANTADKPKKSDETHVLNEKTVDQRGDVPEQEQSNQPQLEKGIHGGNAAENAEIRKTKRRTKKPDSMYDQTNQLPEKDRSNSYRVEGKETGFNVPDRRSDECMDEMGSLRSDECMDEMGSLKHTPCEAAVTDNSGMETQKNSRKRSSKLKKDCELIDNTGKELRYVSQGEGRDEPCLGANAAEPGYEMGPLSKNTDLSAEVGNGKEKTKTKAAKQISKPKAAKQISKPMAEDGIDKEPDLDDGGGKTVATDVAEDKSCEKNGSEMEQSGQVSGKLSRTYSGKDKRRKTTTGLTSKEKIVNHPSDKNDKDQGNISNMEVAGRVIDEVRNEDLASHEVIDELAKADENDQDTWEKSKRRSSKHKNVDQSSDLILKEKSGLVSAEGTKMTSVNADKSSNQDLAANNGNKAGKGSRDKQSYKKGTQTNQEKKDQIDGMMKEDTNNFRNTGRSGKRKKSEVDLTAETTNPADKLQTKASINFGEYFKRPETQQEIAASSNTSVSEGPNRNRAGGGAKMNSGKQKVVSPVSTSLLPPKKHTSEDQAHSDKTEAPISPNKKLRQSLNGGGQASALPKPTTIKYNVIPEDSGNSAASVFGLNKSKKPKRASKSTSNVERFRVSVRKPSKYTGDVVGSSNRKKSLLSLTDAIFNEESNGSSEHEGFENSDASTRTPSDDLLSDYSDTDTLNDDGFRSGGGHSKTKSSLKDAGNLTIDRIFRSSSGYKKARKVAESQLEDTDNPTEFVPDSQANP